MHDNGILLELGYDCNKNSNAIVDKIIQELESEFKRIAPESEQLSPARLGHAITLLNTRIRSQGMTASELHKNVVLEAPFLGA